MKRPLRSIFATACILTFLSVLSAIQAQPIAMGDEFQANAFTSDDQDTASLAIAEDGSFVAVWESFGQDTSFNGVYVRRFDAVGNPLGDDQQANTETFDEQEDADLTLLTGGGFVVVWDSAAQDGDLRGIFGQRFDAAGQSAGDEFQVNVTSLGDQNDAVVAPAADGGFLVVWETDVGGIPENLLARRFDASGQPISGEIEVNTFSDGDQEDADVASDAAGNFVVVWESDGQDGDLDTIVARRFDPAGQPLGDEFVVNTFTTGNQDDPDVAVHPDGRFAVAWEDDTEDSLVDAIFARYFAADGTPASAAFQVDTDPGRQMNPRLALDHRGHAVVIWDSLDQDGAGLGVILNSFDLAGNPEGIEQVVNSTVAGDQLDPHVVVTAHGDAVAVWDSGGQDGSFVGVIGRRYNVHLLVDGFESGDTSAWSATVP